MCCLQRNQARRASAEIDTCRVMLTVSQRLNIETNHLLERFDQMLRLPGWNERLLQMLNEGNRIGQEGEQALVLAFLAGRL